jgi:hypothetical protein
MAAQHLTQGSVKQMRSSMVARDIETPVYINSSHHLLIMEYRPIYDLSPVHDYFSVSPDYIANSYLTLFSYYLADIGHLTAHLSIERRPVQNHLYLLAFAGSLF